MGLEPQHHTSTLRGAINLPPELWRETTSYLPPQDILTVKLVSKKHKNISETLPLSVEISERNVEQWGDKLRAQTALQQLLAKQRINHLTIKDEPQSFGEEIPLTDYLEPLSKLNKPLSSFTLYTSSFAKPKQQFKLANYLAKFIGVQKATFEIHGVNHYIYLADLQPDGSYDLQHLVIKSTQKIINLQPGLKSLTKLQALSLSNSVITDQDLLKLSKTLLNLRHLELAYPKNLTSFACLAQLRPLRELKLISADIPDQDLEALSSLKLTTLYLADCTKLQNFALIGNFSELETLTLRFFIIFIKHPDLPNAPLSSSMLQDIGNHCPKIRYLEIDCFGGLPESSAFLAAFPNLTSLKLRGEVIPEHYLSNISNFCREIKHLYLTTCTKNSLINGLEYLAKNTKLRSLTTHSPIEAIANFKSLNPDVIINNLIYR